MISSRRLLTYNFIKYYSYRSTFYKYSTNRQQENNTFFIDEYGTFTRNDILKLSKSLSKDLIRINDNKQFDGNKVAILCANNHAYLLSILSIWFNKGAALALNKTYPTNVLKYFLNDSNVKLAIDVTGVSKSAGDDDIVKLLEQEKIKDYKLSEHEFFKTKINENNDVIDPEVLWSFNKDDAAFILYTSGSSGLPKGVVMTHKNLETHINDMIATWGWTDKDSILHVLPLNHVHGLINCLVVPLYANAKIEMIPKFNAETVWAKLLDDNSSSTVFMGVPTVYVKLLDTYYNNKAINSKYNKDKVRSILRNKVRVMIAGSAPLNSQTFNDWYDLTGHKILERYGMTEIGMALSSPLIETKTFFRVPGIVGRPLPSVKVRIVDSKSEQTRVLIESDLNTNIINENIPIIEGNLEVKGPNVFKEYLNKPQQTKESFTEDGWFQTGDTVAYIQEINSYKILGRTSIDIIKSGGYKISAVEIEREISAHPEILDVIVFGTKDPKWGEKIVAYIQLKDDFKNTFNLEKFKLWCKSRLPKQSVPSVIKVLDAMPRNHIGKVNKKEIVKQYEKENPLP